MMVKKLKGFFLRNVDRDMIIVMTQEPAINTSNSHLTVLT